MSENKLPLVMKKVREEKGHTVRSLADELGVHYSIISYWEHGIKKPRTGNQIKLEKALGKPIEELLEPQKEEDSDE